MTDAEDFYRESDNERNAERFSASMGLEPENGKVIFLDLFLYTHGIARSDRDEKNSSKQRNR